MRLPSYSVIEHPAELSAGLKYGSDGDLARGPALLTDTNAAAILTGSKRAPWEQGAIWAGATPPTPRGWWTACSRRPATRPPSCGARCWRERLGHRVRTSPPSPPPSRHTSTRSPGTPTG